MVPEPVRSRRRELLIAFATRDLKTRYHTLKLGAISTFGVSLLTMVVLSLAVGRVFRGAVEAPYPIFVLAALVPWNFFASSVNHAADSFRQSASIVRKVPFPRELVPLGAVAANALNLLLSLAAFVPIALVLGVRASWAWLALPLPIAVLVVFAAGLALLVATVGVYYSEVKPLLEVAVMLWFYATPIFYPPSVVPDAVRWVLAVNPMAHLVAATRDILASGRWPHPGDLGYPAIVALAAWIAGRALLRRHQGAIADQVG